MLWPMLLQLAASVAIVCEPWAMVNTVRLIQPRMRSHLKRTDGLNSKWYGRTKGQRVLNSVVQKHAKKGSTRLRLEQGTRREARGTREKRRRSIHEMANRCIL